MKIFVTGTGTGVGKTVFTCALARAGVERGHETVALKPLETGCDPDPEDALALARACGQEGLAHLAGFYRARPPLAPRAATLAGEPPPDFDGIVAATNEALSNAQLGLVEGAGGLLVPLDERRTMADLVAALELPIILVARDGLGVLSHTLTAAACALAQGLELRHVVLARFGDSDPSQQSNRELLQERLDCPVSLFEQDADALLTALQQD